MNRSEVAKDINSEDFTAINLTKSQEKRLRNLPQEVKDCFLGHWQNLAQKRIEIENGNDLFCDVHWDSIHCWPPTKAGEIATLSCVDVLKQFPQIESLHPSKISGNAFRICGENGLWLWGNWTNYTECAQNILDDDPDPIPNPIQSFKSSKVSLEVIRWILFTGSILSFLCLVISLYIFFHFKSIRCDRITLHIHLMVAMSVRFFIFIFISEPIIYKKLFNYRSMDWLCKGVASLLMYVTVASVNWMFIQGHYLHGRLTTKIFNQKAPFKIYFAIGWGSPGILITLWTCLMEIYHPVSCWTGFPELGFIWIIVAPMILALCVNLLFLINIMRILLTKVVRAPNSTDTTQFRRAVKATAVLVPLLGINNLLFVHNPGGDWENFYTISNTIFLSSQGIFVSVLYCFLSSDVRDAIRREYRRFLATRSVNFIGNNQRIKGSFNASSFIMSFRTGLSHSTTSIPLTNLRTTFNRNNTTIARSSAFENNYQENQDLISIPRPASTNINIQQRQDNDISLPFDTNNVADNSSIKTGHQCP